MEESFLEKRSKYYFEIEKKQVESKYGLGQIIDELPSFCFYKSSNILHRMQLLTVKKKDYIFKSKLFRTQGKPQNRTSCETAILRLRKIATVPWQTRQHPKEEETRMLSGRHGGPSRPLRS